jgi:hypothetical protein
MKTTIFTALLILSNAAIAYDDDPNHSFDASKLEETTVNISWKRVPTDQILSACQKMYDTYNLGQITYAIHGCSVWVGKQCTIITGKETTMATLGHESRHCFQHAWHE